MAYSDQMGADSIVSYKENRAQCYRLLSLLFYPLKEDSIHQETLLEDLTGALETVCPEAAALSAGLKESLSESSTEDLLVEYSRLFVGPFELKAPPYGSIYLDGERRLMGDSTIEVRELYRQSGLVTSEEFRDLPDHVTAELEFMYYLAFNELKAILESDAVNDAALVAELTEKQRMFMDRYLGKWIFDFCERISGNTANPFYKTLAACLSSFIAHDKDYLSPVALEKDSGA